MVGSFEESGGSGVDFIQKLPRVYATPRRSPWSRASKTRGKIETVGTRMLEYEVN